MRQVGCEHDTLKKITFVISIGSVFYITIDLIESTVNTSLVMINLFSLYKLLFYII